MKEILEEINRLADMSELESKMINEKMLDLVKIDKGIKKISKGEEHDLRQEFISILCKVLPN